MDRQLSAAERTFKAAPTYNNFQIWFHASRRAGVTFPLDVAPTQDFSVADDSINNFTLFNAPLADIYLRTQLACSNILSAAQAIDAVPLDSSQAVHENFMSAFWLESSGRVMDRRWFWLPQRSMFTYYFKAVSEVATLFINVPYIYGPGVPVMRLPYERCYCGRNTFLVELVGDIADNLLAHLDCFDEDYVIEEEHQEAFNAFSWGYQQTLFERLERLQGTPLEQISPPPNSIELPTSPSQI